MRTTFTDRSGRPGYRERFAPTRPAATLVVGAVALPGLVVWVATGFRPLVFHAVVLAVTTTIGVVALLPRTRIEIAEGAIHVTGRRAPTVVAVDDLRWVEGLVGTRLRHERRRRGLRRGGLVLGPTALRVVGGDGADAFDLLLPTHHPHELIERLTAHRTHPIPIAVVPAPWTRPAPPPVAPAWGAAHG